MMARPWLSLISGPLNLFKFNDKTLLSLASPSEFEGGFQPSSVSSACVAPNCSLHPNRRTRLIRGVKLALDASFMEWDMK